jgi:hypothetical protein
VARPLDFLTPQGSGFPGVPVTGDRPWYAGTFGTLHLDVAGLGEGTPPFGTFVTRQLT